MSEPREIPATLGRTGATSPDERWSEVADILGNVPVYPAPRRVIDGIVAAALNRPVWSLAIERLAPADTRRIVEIASALGRRVVALPADVAAWPEGVYRLDVHQLAALPDACATVPADVLHVGTDPQLDGATALATGIQPVLMGAAHASRHVLVVRDVDELDGLLRGSGTFSSTSTYHEV
jgi:hypothetical protein